MTVRPNFTTVRINGDVVEVRGESKPPIDEITDLQVALGTETADARVGSFGPINRTGETWIASFPVGAAAEFASGQRVVVVGVETRSVPFREDDLEPVSVGIESISITWMQSLQID